MNIFFFMCEKMPNIVLPDTCETFCGRIFIFWVRVLKKIRKRFFFFFFICTGEYFFFTLQPTFFFFICENIRERLYLWKHVKRKFSCNFCCMFFFKYNLFFYMLNQEKTFFMGTFFSCMKSIFSFFQIFFYHV